MADGTQYPTSDHIRAGVGYEEPPYVDPNAARKAALLAELDQLEAEMRPPLTPEERAAELRDQLEALDAESETPEAKAERLEAELEATKAAIPGS